MIGRFLSGFEMCILTHGARQNKIPHRVSLFIQNPEFDLNAEKNVRNSTAIPHVSVPTADRRWGAYGGAQSFLFDYGLDRISQFLAKRF
jgi:hypothetical protein